MHHLPEPAPRSKEFLPSPAIRRTLPASYSEIPAGAAPNLSAESQEAGFLLDYWRMLRRKKGTLTFIAAIGTAGGFLVTLPQTPVYQAKASVEIMGLNQNFLNVKESSPVNEGGTSPDLMDIQTQVTILRSDALTDRVLAKLNGDPPANIQEGRVSAWRKLLNLPDPGPLDPREQALDYVKKHYEVSARPNTRVIQVSAESTDPRLATDFANTLANEFIEQNLEARVNTTERTGNFLSKQLEEMRSRLERSESQLQEYARAAGLLFVADDKSNVSQDKLLQVQKDLSASRTDRIAKQSRWEMANTSPAEALPDILNDPMLRDYQTKLTDLDRQLAELRQTYTPEHAKVKRVQAQIASLQTALTRVRSDILKRIKNEYDEAQRREKLLDTDYVSQRGIVTGEGEKAIQYNILKREVDSNRQLYDAMLQQMKQATLASALRASNIRVVDPAKVPKLPYKPDVFLSSGLGLFAGMFLGVAFVILQERSDRSIQSPGETALYLNLPELGIVPFDHLPKVRIRIAANADAANPAERSGVPALRDRIELVTWQRKPSLMAESFRAALVSILFSGENGDRPRVMVIASSGPSEGKTTVVSNLGIAVAEVNQKVLLIDADLRKPRLHEVFNLPNKQGLSDLLRLKETSDRLPEGMIQPSGIPDLYVMTSGSTTSAATSLLYSNRMPELLRKLRAEFETILIDTPPMLHIPDARVLGRMVDQVILVVRSGKTTRDAATAAYQRFSEDGTRVLGTILNHWNPKHSANGYYGYYSSYYKGYYGKHGYYGTRPESGNPGEG